MIGFFLLYSATNQTLRQDGLDPFLRVNKQVVTAAIGVVLLLAMATFDYRFLKVYAGFIYAGMIVSLLLVRLPFLGCRRPARSDGSRSRFQVTPSEFAKIGLIVMLAASLSEIRHAPATVQDVVRLCAMALVPLVLVFIQPTSAPRSSWSRSWRDVLVAGVSGRRSRPSS